MMIEEIILQILAEKQQGCEKKFIIEQCQNRIPKGSGLSVNDKVINAHLRSLTTRGLIVCAKGHRGKCTWRAHASSQPDVGPQQLLQTEPQPEPDDDDDDDRRSCTTRTSCHKIPRKQKLSRLPSGISEILDGFLYLGSGRDAEDDAQLSRHGITHVLNLARDWPKADHSKYISNQLLAYKHLPLDDTLGEDLLACLEEAFSFLDQARSLREEKEASEGKRQNRVLVHCVLGKSRSPALILAYLMKYENMSLKSAYSLVKQKREIVCPNNSFCSQLMRYEQMITGSKMSTLHWDEIDTGIKTFGEWLTATDVLHKGKTDAQKQLYSKPTHLLWNLKGNPMFHIPVEKREEMFSEFAKACLRGEQLFFIEYRSEPLYCLYLDLDIKCSLDEDQISPSLEEVLGFFLPGIAEVYQQVFSERADQMVSISGGSGPFFHSSYPKVNWKYGYHLVWRETSVDEPRHKTFVNALVEHFNRISFWPLETQPCLDNHSDNDGDDHHFKSRASFPKFIVDYNKLTEVFDTSIFSSTNTMRLLYSRKILQCKLCKSKKPVVHKKKKKNIKKGQGQAKPNLKATCRECEGTGLKNQRPYQFMGIYSVVSAQIDDERTSALVLKEEEANNSITAVRQRIQACSIALTQ